MPKVVVQYARSEEDADSPWQRRNFHKHVAPILSRQIAITNYKRRRLVIQRRDGTAALFDNQDFPAAIGGDLPQCLGVV